MTKQDFEIFAGIFAEEESKIESSFQAYGNKRMRAVELSVLDSTIQNFIDKISDQYPRFNKEIFRAASRPIHAAAHAERVKAAVEGRFFVQ